MITQTKRILEHLQLGKSITPLEALHLFGTFRLSAIIYNLRQDGYEIRTDTVESFDKKYARYSLVVDNNK